MKQTLLLMEVFVVVVITFSLLSPTGDALLPDRGARHISHQTLEQEEKRNRQHVWDWLDRLHNERRNKSNVNLGGKTPSFFGFREFMRQPPLLSPFVKPTTTTTTTIPTTTTTETPILRFEIKESENSINTRNSRSRDQNDDIEVDYADNPENTEDDYFDQISSRSGSSTSSPLKSRQNSLSSMLRFSSNRTGGNVRQTRMSTSRKEETVQKPPHKKSSPSVLNLPPVSTDWSFSCPPERSGWFADVANDCRVYYVCSSGDKNSGGRGERQRFSCPSGTRFNEQSKACDWWDKVDCGLREEGEEDGN